MAHPFARDDQSCHTCTVCGADCAPGKFPSRADLAIDLPSHEGLDPYENLPVDEANWSGSDFTNSDT